MKAKIYSFTSKTPKETTLSVKLFGQKVKPVVMAQAVRVLQDRQHNVPARAKSRGEIRLTTAKVYAQKHTGRARHGARSAPIFVGGGVTHGPKGLLARPLRLTRKVRRLSILGALNHLATANAVSLVGNLEKAKPKTKDVAQLTRTIAGNKSTLFLTGQSYPELQQAANNVTNLTLMPATAVNTLNLLKAKQLLIDETALPALEAWLLGIEVKAPAKSKTSKTTTKKTK